MQQSGAVTSTKRSSENIIRQKKMNYQNFGVFEATKTSQSFLSLERNYGKLSEPRYKLIALKILLANKPSNSFDFKKTTTDRIFFLFR